jgi:hypothetical protein
LPPCSAVASPSQRTARGAFIDRDPVTFRLVLGFLRTDMPPVGLDKTQQALFNAELLYFQLVVPPPSPPPMPAASWIRTSSVEVLGNLSVRKSAQSSGWICNILANRTFPSGVHEWTIRIDSINPSNGICLGVAPPALASDAGSAWTSPGCFVFWATRGMAGHIVATQLVKRSHRTVSLPGTSDL